MGKVNENQVNSKIEDNLLLKRLIPITIVMYIMYLLCLAYNGGGEKNALFLLPTPSFCIQEIINVSKPCSKATEKTASM